MIRLTAHYFVHMVVMLLPALVVVLAVPVPAVLLAASPLVAVPVVLLVVVPLIAVPAVLLVVAPLVAVLVSSLAVAMALEFVESLVIL